MLKKLSLSGLETVINTYLQLDSDIHYLLAPLAGKIITIELLDPPCKMHFLIEKNSIRLLDTLSMTPDASLKGRTINFIKSYFKNPAAKRDIEIEGDSATIIHFSELFQKLDIDWEEHLAKIVGDHVAHIVGKLVRNVVSCAGQWKESMTLNLTEYLHEEVNYFPSREEITLFLDDVDILRNDTERLEAKITLYRQRT